MGFFGKLKANFNHGGVKVRVQAPASAPADQAITVMVAVTADGPQTVNGVKAEIKAQVREQGLNVGSGGVGVQAGRTTNQTVAQAETREAFTLAPGETKTVTLQLYLNGNTNPLGQMGLNGPVGTVLQGVMAAAQRMEQVEFLYSVHATADVDGVALDPSDSQAIQILPPATTAAAGQPGQLS